MNDEKRCPLSEGTVCCKDQCAWWIEDKQKCAIAVLGGKR